MIPLPPHDHTETSARKRKMFGSRRSTGVAGVGIVLKVGADGGLYVKSMQKKGPAWGSNVVQVRSSSARATQFEPVCLHVQICI